jgi:hypothetical protein
LAKTDFRLNRKTSATLSYQYIQETFDFDLGGQTSDQQIHRGAGSISFNPAENLFMVGTFMLENNRIWTPGVGTPVENINLPPNTHPWNYNGNSYSLLLDSTYAFNKKTSCTLSLRHTEGLGTNTDSGGNYTFDKVGVTLQRQIAANQVIGLGYEFYNLDNQVGGDFDDYRANGGFITYSFTF